MVVARMAQAWRRVLRRRRFAAHFLALVLRLDRASRLLPARRQLRLTGIVVQRVV